MNSKRFESEGKAVRKEKKKKEENQLQRGEGQMRKKENRIVREREER